jgi:hypothetical protein
MEWRRRKVMNKEYYEAKAELCRSTAISQLLNGEGDLGMKNLMRMVEALNNAQVEERVNEEA